MSKPLTIDELKALQVGDWVWVVKGNHRCYECKYLNDEIEFCSRRLGAAYKYSDYGTKWLAYKNKEQAERQSKYNVGDTVYFIHIKGYGKTIEECSQLTIFEFKIRRVYSGKTKITYYVKGVKMGIDEDLLIGTKEEAQQRIKELQGK